MEHSPVGMAIVSPTGGFMTANVALCEMLGHDADELDHEVLPGHHPPRRPRHRPAPVRADARRGDRSYRITKRYLRADGSILVGDLSSPSCATPSVSRSTSSRRSSTSASARPSSSGSTPPRRPHEADVVRPRRSSRASPVGLLQIDACGHYLATNGRHREFLELAFPDGHLGQAGQTGFAYDRDQQLLRGARHARRAPPRRGEEFDDVRLWVGRTPTRGGPCRVSARRVLDRTGSAQVPSWPTTTSPTWCARWA